MAAIFVKQQKRRRWAETGVIFTPGYAEKAEHIASDPCSIEKLRAAGTLLANLPKLRSTYAEVEALKGVCSMVCAIADGQAPAADARLLTLIADILFMENSRPVHRQLLSGLHRMPPRRFEAFKECINTKIKQICQEYQAQRLSRLALHTKALQGLIAPRAILAEVIFSLLEFKPLQQHLRAVCPESLAVLAHGVLDVLCLSSQGARIQVHTAEEVQDAISGMYAILQLHGSYVTSCCRACSSNAITDAAEAMILLLQDPALISKEGLASAAVLLAALSALPEVPPARLAAMLAAAMWPELQLQGGGSAPGDHSLGGLEGPEPKNGQKASSMGIVEAHLHRQGASLADRLASLQHPVRVCALKGLVAVLPLAALCAPLSAAQQFPTSSTDHPEHSCSASAALPLQGARGKYNIATAPESALGEGSRAAASEDSRRSFPALDDKFAQQRQQPRNEQISSSGAQLQQAQQTEAQWAFLMHGALPFACGAISAASDAHQKFHAVALLTTCLQRVKECLEEASKPSDVTIPAEVQVQGSLDAANAAQFVSHLEADPLVQDMGVAGGLSMREQGAEDLTAGLRACAASDRSAASYQLPIMTREMHSRIMSILWANLEEPVNQTLKQVHIAFDTLLDILSIQDERPAALRLSPEQDADFSALLEKTAADLTAMSSHRKGKYAPLRMLASRLGATRLLQLQPGLVRDMLHAMRYESVCPANASLLEAVLGSLRHECMESAGSSREALSKWEDAWCDAMLEVLASSEPRLSANVSTYALSVPLAMESGSLITLLQRILAAVKMSDGTVPDGQVASLVAVLKVARQLNLARDLNTVIVPGHDPVHIPEALLQRAIEHGHDTLLVDAMALACSHPKSTAVPGVLELRLVARGLSLGMRCTSVSLRNKWTTLLGKLLRRIAASTHCVLHRWDAAPGGAALGAAERAERDRDMTSLQPVAAWTRWFTRLLLGSLYPGAPFERKFMAMLLLETLLTTWNTPDKANRQNFRPEDISMTKLLASAGKHGLKLFCPGFPGAQATQVLLSSVVECWDKLRESSISVLMSLESPLPGIDTPAALKDLAMWAQRLVSSPRVRESDAGSRLQSLVFRKYVLGLGWEIRILPNGAVLVKASDGAPDPVSSADAILAHLGSLADCLEADVAEAEESLEQACRHGLSHGKLLCLRYLIPDIPWHTLQSTAQAAERLRAWAHRLVGLALRAAQSALPPLSTPQETGLAAGDDEGHAEDAFEDEDAEHASVSSSEPLAHRGQMVVTGCWLTVKEASLLLGSLASEAPIAKAGSGTAPLLAPAQLAEVGRQLMRFMGVIKHSGAVEKAQAGFIALCDRLLREPRADLNQLPRKWLGELLGCVRARGQHRNDIVRRSAGLPFALMGLFLAEPPGSHKALLQEGMQELLKTADDTRASEPWPCVHALNVLCQAFNDRHLALDISGFCAQGVVTAIGAMSAPAWEIRNSASLAFTSLLMRAVGFKNVTKGEVPKRAVTGVEFFHRFPLLHSYLLGQLCSAAQGVREGTTQMHPSLYPILVLLSRLRHATQAASSTEGDELSPSVFAPVVRQFALARPMAVRHLAAQALAPLVMPKQLGSMLDSILSDVPCSPPISSHNHVHGCLLQVEHLLDAHASSLPASEGNALLARTAALLLERAWLATQLCAASAVRTQCLRAAGALISAASVAGLPGSGSPLGAGAKAETGAGAAPALARALLGICQEAIIGQEQPAAADSSLRQTQLLDASHGAPAAALRQQVSTASGGAAGTARSNISFYSNGDSSGPEARPADMADAGADGADTMRAVFLKEAAQLYFSPALRSLAGGKPTGGEAGVEGLQQEEVRAALEHPLYDVRAATLKALLACCKGGMPAWLAALIRERASCEQHHKVKRRALQLMMLPVVQPAPYLDAAEASNGLSNAGPSSIAHSSVQARAPAGTSGCQLGPAGTASQASSESMRCSVLKEVQALQQQLHDAQHPEVKAKALRGVGAAVSAITLCWHGCSASSVAADAAAQSSSACTATLDAFLASVEGASRATEPTEMRIAAVHALKASSLLQPSAAAKGSAVRQQALIAWTQGLKLMEDEDDEVRREAARSASGAISAQANTCSPSTNVEHVERMAFVFMSINFGNLPEYHEQIRHWIYEPTSNQLLDSSWQPGAVHKLFEKELDNHHEERLLIAQLASQQLVQLLQRPDAEPLLSQHGDNLKQWVLRCLKDLAAMSSCLAELQPGTSWLGGLTNHPDAFSPLYHLLLGVHSAAACICGDELLRTSAAAIMRQAAEALLACGVQPLIGNLLNKVLHGSLCKTGAQSNLQNLAHQLQMALDEALDPEFDPAFLLQGFEVSLQAEVSTETAASIA